MLLPSENIPDSKLFSYDKFGHLGVFALLYLFLVWGLSKQNQYQVIRNKSKFWALTISIVYSTALEFLQILIPGRAFDLFDIVANSSGIFTGLIIFSFLNKK
jgi:VanZ family protein